MSRRSALTRLLRRRAEAAGLTPDQPPAVLRVPSLSLQNIAVRPEKAARHRGCGMGKTDGDVTRSGIYQSICDHRVETPLTGGLVFPGCRDCGSVEWKLIRDKIPAMQQ